MKQLFITILLFLFLFSCKKEYQPVEVNCSLTRDIDSIKKFLPGTWVWLQEKRVTRGAQQYQYLTPKTEGYNLTLKFEGNKAYYFKNNQPDSVYTYDVVMQLTITGQVEDSLPVIVFYKISNGVRYQYVPVKACPTFLLMQYQFVTSIFGEDTWKKQ